jgi:hypothetical protein
MRAYVANPRLRGSDQRLWSQASEIDWRSEAQARVYHEVDRAVTSGVMGTETILETQHNFSSNVR